MTLEPARKRAEWDAAHGRTTVVLPWPPAVNNLFATFNNRRIPSRRYKLWQDGALTAVREQRPRPITGSFRATISCSPPDRRRRDLDGLAKAPLDLLVKAGVIEDDHKARGIILEWDDANPAKPGSVTVTLERA